MPMIELTIPAGAIDAEGRTALADELATKLLAREGAPDTDFFRTNTWVYVNEVSEEQLLVGGRDGGEGRFKVEITTPKGALSQRRREGIVADAHAAVSRAAGLSEEEGYRVWVLCREIDEGSWGAGGGVVMFEQLKAAAKAEKERSEEPAVAS